MVVLINFLTDIFVNFVVDKTTKLSYLVWRKVRNCYNCVKSFLEEGTMKPSRSVRVGTAGWEHEVFDECLYPLKAMESTEKLAYYAQFFDTVEVRQTFWDETIDVEEARQWMQAVAHNKRFRFNLKLHSSFTHRRQVAPRTATRIRALLQELAKEERLGALVAQFPFSFTNTSTHRVHLVRLGELFAGFHVHIELRHHSWDQPSLLSFLVEQGLHPVGADLPRLKQFVPFLTGVTDERAYLRAHGRNERGWLQNGMDLRYDYLYNAREIRELTRRVYSFLLKCRDVTVIFNNTTGGKAIANALQLSGALREDKRLVIPLATARAFPSLEGSVPEAETDQMLFGVEELRRAV
jgi:uncharacterized protein YecE (DUF72 family)